MPHRHTGGTGANPGMQWPNRIPSSYDMEPAHHLRMPVMFPPTAESEAQAAGPPTPPLGCGSASDDRTRNDEAAGFQDERTDMYSAENAWERLLENIRGTGESADNGTGTRKRSRSDDDGDVVEIQPKNRMLLPQSHRETCTSMWVVNSNDWIEVEHVIRHMLKCESSECSAFHSIGYIFFRSCAVSHITSPSDYLEDGAHYKFPGTDVAISITRVHAEGVLEVQCYLEYAP